MADLQSVMALVLDSKRRILTIDDATYGGVGMPFGDVGENDAPLPAAIRMLGEKVGLQAEPGALMAIYGAHWRFKVKGKELGDERLVTLFYVRAVRGTPQAVEGEVRWLPFMDLRGRSTFVSYYQAALGPSAGNLRNFAPTEMT